jgi:hydroxymethylbilane synthase
MNTHIRIGTRESRLALWQANHVKSLLEASGSTCELVHVKSEGDVNVTTPLYEIGVQGIFTKALDVALLENRIDVAVHSMKDVPVVQAKGITEAAVLKRGSPADICVFNCSPELFLQEKITVGTSSLRRKAQWLSRYPHHIVAPIRGNVETRLQKLNSKEFDAVVFADAGLERLSLKPQNHFLLDWMLPAPAQGALLVSCRENNSIILEKCKALNDEDSLRCVTAERIFLKQLQAGCSAPVGALAEILNGEIVFKGNVLSINGTQKLEVQMKGDSADYKLIGEMAAADLIKKGALKLR